MSSGAAGQADLASFLVRAYEKAPAVRDIFDGAGVAPASITDSSDLAQVPVMPKERLIELQRMHPPFGGFLGVELSDVSHVYVSAGPIYEPAARVGHGFGAAVAAAGVRPGDIVLNTWSYHLVPAGLVLDEAFRSVGAMVIPAGTGNSALLAQVVLEMGVTVIAASTAFFETIIGHIESEGHRLPDDWGVRLAYLGAEFGDWPAKRRRLESRLGLRTFSFYGTGDVGLIGIECEAREGYHIVPEVIVQICDSATGALLPEGQLGEVVVTNLCDAWPLVRFGTGDVSALAAQPCACGSLTPKIGPVTGRVGQAIKVREIFVYPHDVARITSDVPQVRRIHGSVVWRFGRDEVDIAIEIDERSDPTTVRQKVAEAFTVATRLRPGTISVVASGTIGPDEPVLVNVRDREQAILDRLFEVLRDRVPQPGDGVDEQRRQFERLSAKSALAEGVNTTSLTIGGRPAERLEPAAADSSRSILWFHGGGYVIGSLNTVRPLASRIAAATRTAVVTLDYRLAPEHPFPAAVDDAVSAYQALLAEFEPGRLAVGGDSAGAGLAVALLLALRNHGLPMPAAGVCLSPWVDLTMTAASYESAEALDPQAARWQLTGMAKAYLGDADPQSPLASPVFEDLQGLPPLLVHAGGAERMLDDAVALAHAAEAAGVHVTFECWDRMPHVWHAFAPKLPAAVAGIDALAHWLSATWGHEGRRFGLSGSSLTLRDVRTSRPTPNRPA
jgi:phenylacetate-CoA ligase